MTIDDTFPWTWTHGAGTDGPLFISERRMPLDAIMFDRQRGLDLFGNNCDGHCGV